MTGLYSNARSVHLQKYKEFFDEDCVIVGFKEGDGLEKGCVIWICEIDGKEFACRPRGTREDRQGLFESGDNYIGKMLTVRYQEKTDDGLLRFPVGIAIRDYE
jgi:DNA ligase-1